MLICFIICKSYFNGRQLKQERNIKTPRIYTNRFKLSTPIRVAIVDDHLMFRQGLIAVLKNYKNINVVFEAENGKEAIEKIKTTETDVVLLDISMPIMDGLEAAGNLSVTNPDVKMLIVSMHDANAMVVRAMNNGCHGYVLKGDCVSHIIESIFVLRNEFYYFNRIFKKTILKRLLKGKLNLDPFKHVVLSQREKEVAYLISMEFSSKEIGEKLFLSKRTVEFHRENIIRKIGARNAVGIGKYAVKYGMV